MKFDWTQAEHEYVTTKISLREISEKYGQSFNTVKQRSRKDCWGEKRRKYNEKLMKRMQSKSIRKEARKLDSLKRSADRMAKEIEKALQDPEQFYKYICTIKAMGTEYQEEKIFTKIDTKALRDVTNALKELSSVFRNLNEIPTQAEAEAQAIARERLELDKKKANTDEDTGKEVIVRMEGLEDYAN